MLSHLHAVTYRAGKDHWLVASGHGPKGEFYRKRILRRDQALNFAMSYPSRLHHRYAPLIRPLTDRFTIGRDSGF